MDLEILQRQGAKFRRQLSALGACLCLIANLSCVTNPATGERDFSLISEDQEIALGNEARAQIAATIGIYEDPALQAYVSRIGMQLAKVSERPDLPWSFTIADDPVVNAFALPGGHIFVTRGLLTHLTSEAQLSGVLGHEIAHVTARHSANQMSKAMAAQLGLGLGMVLRPELAQFGEIAQGGIGLLFLKFSRDDEREADQIGLRYMSQENYDPRQLAEVFSVLEEASQAEETAAIPSWLQTHPPPKERAQLIRQQIKKDNIRGEGLMVKEDSYLQVTDGMVFGENPRHGFFAKTRFYHPELRFRVDFPGDWTVINQNLSAGAASPNQEAAASIKIVPSPTAVAAADQFANQRQVRVGPRSNLRIAGQNTIHFDFQALTPQGVLMGQVAFFDYQDTVFQLMGLSSAAVYDSYAVIISQIFASFKELVDPAILTIQPQRIRVVELPFAMTLAELVSRHEESRNMEQIALINHLDPADQLAKGRLVRLIEGQEAKELIRPHLTSD
jgi:predicted Zn-dependent protease